MNAVRDNEWSRAFRALGENLARPRAILAISAHWYVAGTFLTGDERPRTIHDFGGFPRELYEVQYPAPGDAGLARRAADLLSAHSGAVRQDWGLDHGTWSVLRHMFPNADVPVVQLSIDGRAPGATHAAIGAALAPLRDDGVLILGSGNLVHNLPAAFRKMNSGDTSTESWAEDFDQRVASFAQNRDMQGLAHACDDSTGRLAHPTPDHFLPVVYTSAAAGRDADVSFPIEGFDMGDVSMRAILYS